MRSRSPLAAAALLTITVLAALPARSAADPGTEFFEKKVRPLLVEHCYKCHSAADKKVKGGLALDTREGARKGGDSGPAVVPGKPGDSLLVQAVRYKKPDLRMPPKHRLPDAAIADLEQWVRLGAPDPRTTAKIAAGVPTAKGPQSDFWAYQPPRPASPPVVKDTNWPRSDVDRFVLNALEAQGLTPATDADRATLLRRVHFDLIGLPPTPEQLEAFLRDPSPEALGRVVDELLASPHFGERWGRRWLDVARYAESSGGGRSLLFKDAWRYRDYVIDAYNRDLPFDRFVTEQVAGDLLPHATPDERQRQLVATGFLVLGPTNYERQDKDILEMDVIDEQLDTLGRTILGMTIGCARCHDHKFDPIPTRDYYALAGVFKSTQVLIHDNVSRWVEQPLPVAPATEAVLAEHERAVAALKERLKVAKAAEAKSGKVVAAKGIVPVKDLPGLVLDDSQAKRVGEWTASKFSSNYIGDGYLHDANADKGRKTLTFVPEFPQAGRYEVRLSFVAGGNRATKVPVTVLHLDGEQTFHIDQSQVPPIDGRFVSLGTFRFNTNGQWFVMVSNEGTSGHVVVDAVQFLPEGAAGTKPDDKSAKPAPDVKALEAELKRLTESGPERPVAMAVKEAAKVEDCRICIRGNFHNPGVRVPRGYLSVLPVAKAPTPPAKESGRRELAAWLVSPDNPLTARVYVNRVWQALFGAGIVRTTDVFGVTGEKPSHPALLDHLALEFVREGWSTKRLVRSLVLTRAYQTAVTPRSDGSKIDPENRLLWHANRRRLDAECLRDAMLTVSGRLDRSVGGPNWRKGTSSEVGYVFDDARRSVYTPVFRNRLPELYEVFDFADPNLVLGRRATSTVAPQALFLMNSPAVMEEARHAARATAGIADDAVRLERAYRAVLGRSPTARERSAVTDFLAGQTSAAGRAASWERVYQTLFACIDFRYVE